MEKCVRCNEPIESIELSNLCKKCFKHLNNDMNLIDNSPNKLTDTGNSVMTTVMELIDKVVIECSENV